MKLFCWLFFRTSPKRVFSDVGVQNPPKMEAKIYQNRRKSCADRPLEKRPPFWRHVSFVFVFVKEGGRPPNTVNTNTKRRLLHRHATHHASQKTSKNDQKLSPKSSKICGRRPPKRASEKRPQKTVNKNRKNVENRWFWGPQTLGNPRGLSELFVTFLVSGAFGAALGRRMVPRPSPSPPRTLPNLDF